MNSSTMGEGGESGSEVSGGRRPPLVLIALVIVALYAFVFVLRNGDRTTIDFLFFEVDSRVWVAIAISIALGIVLDRLILAWWRRTRRRRNSA